VDFRNATAPSPVIYKLHGDIAHRESLVVTDEDYIQFAMRMGDKDPYDPIPLSLKFYLTGSTTLFVGYSLLDYNLRLLFKALRWKIEAANVPDMYSEDFRARSADHGCLARPASLREVHRPRRVGLVPRLYELVVGEELAP
jgi:hypothetical protein